MTKKYFIITAAILLMAAACGKVVEKQPDTGAVFAEFGKSITLRKGETANFRDSQVSLKLTDFYFQPCPKGTECVWSGLDIFYEITVSGRTYIKDKPLQDVLNFPYEVVVEGSDYKNYATFVVNSKNESQNFPQGNKEGWNTYSNPKFSFEIKYPNEYKVFTNVDSSEFSGITCQTDKAGEKAACITLDRKQNDKTNFVGAAVLLNIPSQASSCLSPVEGETVSGRDENTNVIISGVSFALYSRDGAAAGTWSKSKIYRTLYNNTCYEINLELAGTNIGNYDPSSGVKEFNENQIWSQLDQILSTFKFIDSNASSNPSVKTKNSGTFQFSPSEGYYGTLHLTGYLKINHYVCNPGDMCNKDVDYASFIFSQTDNSLIYKFLQENEGNSYVTGDSVGLGCYEKDKKQIYSKNVGDDGWVDSVIDGNNLSLLLSSSKNNPVRLQLTKPVFSGGGEAPDCYSHFRSFKVSEG